MTLMPVSNMSARGSSWSNAGESRWISHRSSTAPMSSVSSASPSTLKTWPSVASPTGTDSPRPRFRTGVPRCRPSVALRHTQRTRPSPICCATSAVTVTLRAFEVEVHLDGHVDLGQARGAGTRRRRPARDGDHSPFGAVTVVAGGGLGECGCHDVLASYSALGVGGLAQCLGSPDDLHDLGGDGVLTGAVHVPSQRLGQLVGVLGGRRHGPLPGRVLAGGRLEQGAEQRRLDIAGHQLHEEVGGLGLEFGVPLASRCLVVVARPRPWAREAGGAGASRPPGCRPTRTGSRRSGPGRPPRRETAG